MEDIDNDWKIPSDKKPDMVNEYQTQLEEKKAALEAAKVAAEKSLHSKK